ncbi:unnamed protein product, partial [Rotaria sp. Silwood1]
LEMNFADPSDRVVMGRYARTEALSEPDSEEDDHVDESLSSSLKLNESSESSSDITEDEDKIKENCINKVNKLQTIMIVIVTKLIFGFIVTLFM